MPADFSDEAYASLLDAGLDAGYEFITVREYLSSEQLPERFLIVRHDVDRKPMNALQMARTEAVRDIPTTYYYRIIPKTFRPELIQQTEQLGHEIGYHYEDLDTADGDIEAAHESFARTSVGSVGSVRSRPSVCTAIHLPLTTTVICGPATEYTPTTTC